MVASPRLGRGMRCARPARPSCGQRTAHTRHVPCTQGCPPGMPPAGSCAPPGREMPGGLGWPARGGMPGTPCARERLLRQVSRHSTHSCTGAGAATGRPITADHPCKVGMLCMPSMHAAGRGSRVPCRVSEPGAGASMAGLPSQGSPSAWLQQECSSLLTASWPGSQMHRKLRILCRLQAASSSMHMQVGFWMRAAMTAPQLAEDAPACARPAAAP